MNELAYVAGAYGAVLGALAVYRLSVERRLRAARRAAEAVDHARRAEPSRLGFVDRGLHDDAVHGDAVHGDHGVEVDRLRRMDPGART